MAIRPLNSIAGFSTGDPAVTIIQANGDVSTINFTANGLSNLGPVGNVTITGGTTGQYLKTDGNGVLSFGTVDVTSNNAGPMPYFIPTGESYIVNENFQGLFAQTITIDGELVVDGSLIEVGIAINSDPTQIYFDYNGVPTGNTGFTFDYISGNMAIPGNLQITGNILPSANVTYNLGSSTKRFNDIWLSNSTIYIGNSSITTDANTLVLESGSGATITVTGDANTSIIENGTSNITIDLDSDIRFGVGGTPNVLILTSNGIDYDGELVVNGNITANGGNLTGNVVTANTANINNALINISLDMADSSIIQFKNNANSNIANIYLVDDDVLINSGNGISNLVFGGGAMVLASANANIANLSILLADDGAEVLINNSNNITNLNFGNGSMTLASSSANANLEILLVDDEVLINNGNGGNIVFGGGAFVADTGNIALYANGYASVKSLDVVSDALIGGNLTVNGNVTYINVDTIQVEDPIISLGGGPNGAPLTTNDGKDRGTLLQYYTSQPVSAFMGWDNSNAEFSFGSNVSLASEVVTFNTLGNIRAQTFKGNIEATTISGSLTTASQANITTVGTLGSLNVTANIDSGNVNGGNVVKGNYLVSNSGCVSVNGAMIAFNNATGAAGIFSSLVTDINLGLSANIVLGNSATNVTIQGNLIANGSINTTGNISANLITGTLTTAAQANITTVGTLGNLTVSGNTVSNIIDANTTQTQSIVSKRSNVAVTTLTVIDSFATSAYRTAKYVVSSQNDDGFESLEVLLIHNDINSFITVYGAINDGGGNTVTMSTGINSGNVELRATGLAGNTVVKLIGTYVPD